MTKKYQTSDFEGEDKPKYLGHGRWSSPGEKEVENLLEEGDRLVQEFKAVKQSVQLPPQDSTVERSPSGGLNSKVSGRWDLLDTDALTRLSTVLEYGSSKPGYTDDNWRLDSVELHLKHALEHIFKYLKLRRTINGGRVPYRWDGSEDELGHAFCRIMFALAVEFQDETILELAKLHNGVE